MAQGMTQYGGALALPAVMTSGAYVGLLTTLPTDLSGTGHVEASVGGYARKAHSSWIFSYDGTYIHGKNNGAITFNALTEALTGVVGWGIWHAASGGNLMAFGPISSGGGSQDFIATDQPQFASQTLDLFVGSA